MNKVYKRQLQSIDELNNIWDHPEQVNVIHYSCESFYDRPEGNSPRITSIAVRNLKTAQTQSFSIHKFGELKGYSANELNKHYDDLEEEMLAAFFGLAKERKEYKWLHWNMRDENFGFHALELRYKVLGGTPFIIDDLNKFDLSRILIGIYGKTYMNHPRLENLRNKNKLSTQGFITGKDEAEFFENKNYVGLHQSTLSKANLISDICQLAYEGKLQTNANWWDVYGHSLKAFMLWFSNNPFTIFIVTMLSLIANIYFVIKLFFSEAA